MLPRIRLPGVRHSGVTRWFQRRIVQPFQESRAPVTEVAWGAAIGAFCALPPILGKTALTVGTWTVARYAFKFRFSLPPAIAMVLLVNPVTMVPIYYFYLKTGDLLLAATGRTPEPMDYGTFRMILDDLQGSGAGVVEGLWRGAAEVLWRFGRPLLIGGALWTAIGTSVAYPLTRRLLIRYRSRAALREGLTLAAWTAKYVRRP